MKNTVNKLKDIFQQVHAPCIFRSVIAFDCLAEGNNMTASYKKKLLSVYGNKYSVSGDLDPNQVVEARLLVDNMTGSDINNKSVVEYGCAEGTITYLMLKKYYPYKYIGIDTNEDAMTLCEQMKILHDFKCLKVIQHDYMEERVYSDTAICANMSNLITDLFSRHNVVYFSGDRGDVIEQPWRDMNAGFDEYIRGKYCKYNVSTIGVARGTNQPCIFRDDSASRNYYMMRVSKS